MKAFHSPLKIYGVKLLDDDKLLQSQSGGAFTLIAEYFLKKGAAVYGVGQDINNDAVYMRVDTVEDLLSIKGSKYVQAKMNDVFQNIKEDLANGKTVLYSGTSCSVMAVKLFTQNMEYAHNLYTVDLICHGVPSPKVYKDYIEYIEKNNGARVKQFIFRDKKQGGWNKHLETVVLNNKKTIVSEEYTQLFYSNFIIRPSCGECPFTKMERASDFTIGDYWGIKKAFPEEYDEKGVSLLMLNSSDAIKIFEECKRGRVCYFETNEEKARLQPPLFSPSYIPKCRELFWRDYRSKGIYYCIHHWTKLGRYSFKMRRKLLKMLKKW